MFSGKFVLQQFLWFKFVVEMVGGVSKGLMEQMKVEFVGGCVVDVVGYCLGVSFVLGFDVVKFVFVGVFGCVEWLEFSIWEDVMLMLVVEQVIESWWDVGWVVCVQVVQGLGFWFMVEIELVLVLIVCMVEVLV